MSPIVPDVPNEDPQAEDNLQPRLTEYNDITVEATLNELRTAQAFIAALQEATLEGDTGLDADAKDRLQNPITEPVDLTEEPHLRAGIDIYLNTTNASEETYKDVRQSIRAYLGRLGVDDQAEDNSMPSLFTVKKEIGMLTGVHSIMTDMCINTCLAYTGPFAELDSCPYCSQPRYDPAATLAGEPKRSRRQFHTLPVGPQLQAIWRNPEDAKAMRHRVQETRKILEELEQNNYEQALFDDVYSGSDYLDAVRDGKIADDDMVLMLSIDGAQLYQSKQSDCWIYIWVVLDLAPDRRYKKRYVLPGGFIPGPDKPKNVDSFLFPGFYHVTALMKEGMRFWDAYQDLVFRSNPFIMLGAADGPGLTYLNGLTGHSGAHGCRFYCPMKGRRKPGANHYYPALLKPHDYTVDGCDHDDVDGRNLDGGSQDEYLKNLEVLLGAHTQAQYQKLRKDTGISKPSLFSGFPNNRMLGIPSCFGPDLMHLISLNLTDLLLGLWRGILDCDPHDDRASWDWAVLKGDIWKNHGKRVADATRYLPGSFDRPPRNPVEKISSGYKAWEFLTYVYGLGPGLFYDILPLPYWKNFCKLVRGVRLLHQRSITASQILQGHNLLVEFVMEFEELYYQRKTTRLHFCRQSVHALLHIGPETTRIGPGTYSTQWTMERMIGILGQEIRQPSNPFQNLSERGLRRARINALEKIIPDLAKPNPQPRCSSDLGDGYIMLGARDPHARFVHPTHIPAIQHYFASNGMEFGDDWVPQLKRWARVELPTRQIVRTAWKENSRSGSVRISRIVIDTGFQTRAGFSHGFAGYGLGSGFLTQPQPVPPAAGRAGARPPAAAQCRAIQAEFEIEINEVGSLISISNHLSSRPRAPPLQ
jgi:hypothetical protein